MSKLVTIPTDGRKLLRCQGNAPEPSGGMPCGGWRFEIYKSSDSSWTLICDECGAEHHLSTMLAAEPYKGA